MQMRSIMFVLFALVMDGDTIDPNVLLHALIVMQRAGKPSSSDTFTPRTFLNFSGDRDIMSCVSHKASAVTFSEVQLK